MIFKEQFKRSNQMSLIYQDPCGTTFAGLTVTAETCDAIYGKIVGFGIVSKATTAFTLTGAGDLKLKASWTAAKAASTDVARAIVLGELSNVELTAGQPTKVDSGKANGVQKLVRTTPASFKAKLDGKTEAFYKSLNKLSDISTNYTQGTKIAVIFLYETGYVQYNNTAKGVPIFNFFVSDPSQGDDSLTREISFDMEGKWSENTTFVKATDFVPLDIF